MYEKVLTLFRKGLFHVIGSNFINKIIAFVTNIAIVRILAKNDFGIFVSAFNVFSVIFLFSGLGVNSGLLYFCSKDMPENTKAEYFKFCYTTGNIINFGLSFILLLYAILSPFGIIESKKYILQLSFLPAVAFQYDYYAVVLRSQKEVKKYSLLMNLNSVSYLMCAVIGSLLGGITGTIVGRYISYLLSAVVGRFLSRKHVTSFVHSAKLQEDKRKKLMSYSVKAGMTSALNNILYLIDIYIIGVIITDPTILASYKVGAQIPENLNFIPQSVMVFFLPYFIQHAKDRDWIARRTKELYLGMGGIAGAISIVLILFAPLFVKILWGSQYLDAVPCFRILTVSFFFLSTFRITSTNILLSLGKPGFTLFVSVITGLCNLLLDLFLTINFGSIGAAYATLFVTVIASLISFPYVILSVRRIT